MHSPIIGANQNDEKEPEFIQTGQRQKGDPMTSECFAEIKKLLAGMPANGLNKTKIAEQTKSSIATVRLIGQSENFAEYRLRRSSKSNWVKPKPVVATKKPGFLARLFGKKP